MKKKLIYIIAFLAVIVITATIALCIIYIPRLGEYSGKSMKIQSVDKAHYIELPLAVTRATIGDNIFIFQSKMQIDKIIDLVNNMKDRNYSYSTEKLQDNLYKLNQYENEKLVANYYLGKTQCSCGRIFFTNYNYLEKNDLSCK